MRAIHLSLKSDLFIRCFFFLILALVLFMMFYFPDYTRVRKLRQENERLRGEIKKVETEILDLETKIKKVGKDPSIYEKFARENLGAAKEDEIVVDIH